jgi:excisionase family DNA binding protein
MADTHTYSDDGYVSVAEAAAEVGVHGDTIRRWADAGRLTAYRTPTGHRRFKVADVRALLAAEQSQPTETTPTGGERGVA